MGIIGYTGNNSRLNYFLLLFPVIGLMFLKCAEPVKNGVDHTQHVQAIREIYGRYTNAIGTGNGLEAASYLSEESTVYYNALIDLVLHADSSKLALTDPLVCFSALAIKQTVDWKVLRPMAGKDLFAFAIANGMIGRDSEKTTLGDMAFKNDTVVEAVVLLNNNKTNQVQRMLKQNGTWRVDLQLLLSQNESALQQSLQQFEGNQIQKLTAYFKAAFGTYPDRTLWLPVERFNR